MTSQSEENSRQDLDLSAYRQLFLDEAQMFLTTLRENVVRLADNPADGRALQEARRAAHTLRGMASTMRYEDLAALAMELEGQFQSELPLTLDQITLLLAGCDEFEMGLKRLRGMEDGQTPKDNGH